RFSSAQEGDKQFSALFQALASLVAAARPCCSGLGSDHGQKYHARDTLYNLN
ncbi:hypothetical protein HAX54_039258, partial [Datura stramonium]|nr:hypothetical protein [Datura stramonium]